MAEIKIEKKKPIWPWILAILALIALFVYFFVNDSNEVETAMNETESAAMINTTNGGINGDVEGFVRYVEADAPSMGLDHAYANEALMKLTAATRAVATETGYDIQADLNQVKEYADKIATDPFETTHANSIRKAADILTGSLKKMQQAHFPQLNNEVNELEKAAGSIDPDVLTLDQKESVKAYFGKAANLLQKMNQSLI